MYIIGAVQVVAAGGDGGSEPYPLNMTLSSTKKSS